jgi:hypothetical protein
MIRLAAAALCFISVAAPAGADTNNVRKGHSHLQFRTAAAGASGGSTVPRAPAPLPAEKKDMFRYLDIDGDSQVSKAEAAGHASVTLGFDRADRNRDGKLSFVEFDSIGKPRPPRKKAASAAASASAGASKKKAN